MTNFDVYKDDGIIEYCTCCKWATASGQHKNDNWIDIAGYAACGAELQEIFD